MQCYQLYGGCAGSIGDACWPEYAWSGVYIGDGIYHTYVLGSGGFSVVQHVPTYAFSVPYCMVQGLTIMHCGGFYFQEILQLCDYHTGSAVVSCGYGWFCEGSVSACHPSHIWSSTQAGSTEYFAAPVWSGSFNLQALTSAYAISVRYRPQALYPWRYSIFFRLRQPMDLP